ncbi:MAG: acyltransferase [Tenuifilaceae bacterium]|jgi:phenylacetate-coenzyme A ligase PaaK-like adenylate-forming protein|nr:acyltransferase [Tenuifilaceae bacterium]
MGIEQSMGEIEQRIFEVDERSFEQLALEVFQYQAQHNEVYRRYIELLKIDYSSISKIDEIPFLPISLFKTHTVYAGVGAPEATFSSSGTTGVETSKHNVAKLSVYETSFLNGFKLFYGNPKDYCILALLPSYLERQGSSLVYMVQRLIEESGHKSSGFFLNNHDELVRILLEQEKINQPTVVVGVTFALLDLANRFTLNLSNTVVMETGGMKGRGKELVRSDMHDILKKSLGIKSVHSEYGMTELLSQAYSKGDGIFETPPWMKVLTRDPYDPFSLMSFGQSGAINVIDLANIYSCSFIQTDDLGMVYPNGTFAILGRMDGSQIRGCNLLVL